MESGDKYQLILASHSPRRKELLAYLGIPFRILGSGIEEVATRSKPTDIVEELAILKGEDVWGTLAREQDFGKVFFPLVVSSDTLVSREGKIYGKPKDRAHARQMLYELSGQKHLVATGVCLIAHDRQTAKVKKKSFVCTTEVTFDPITEDVLELYLDTGESLDKAGGYGVQGKALSFVSHLNGSYSNVVGFPVSDFIFHLKEFLGLPRDQRGDWRKFFLHCAGKI